MSKKNKVDPLNREQREALNQAHGIQITLEISLVVLLLALFTINIASVYSAYGVVDLLAMAFAGLLIFIFGILATQSVSTMKRIGKPLEAKVVIAKRWLVATWLSVPTIILLAMFNSPFADGEFRAINLILIVAVIIFTIVAIVGSLVSIHLVWRRFNRNKRSPVRLVAYGALAMTMLLLVLLGSYTTTKTVEYSSAPITDSNLELGQSEVKQVGKNGEKEIKHNLIFGFQTSSSGTEPVDEIIANGSRRYQYMYCSDGSYRHYTAEQFKNPSIGFTHQSPDYCAQNGNGTQTTIADVPPAETIIQQAPSYYRPSSYITTCDTYSYSSSITCRTY